MAMISFVFVLCSLGFGMIMDSIVTLFGLFSALGAFYYFILSVYFWIQYPVIKAENSYMDKENTTEILGYTEAEGNYIHTSFDKVS